MANKVGPEVWFQIAERVAEDDWKPLFRTLPYVSWKVRGGVVKYLQLRVLPHLQKIGRVMAALPMATRCHRLQMELEREIPISNRHWQKHIHIVIKELLKSGCDNVKWQRFHDLIGARVDLNARTSQNQTPLLILCDSLGTLFSSRLAAEERTAKYDLIVEIMQQLLEHGADPNRQGFPSTPLATILSQQPPSDEERVLMGTLVELLLEHGADGHHIPTGDIYDLNKKPLEMAAEFAININV